MHLKVIEAAGSARTGAGAGAGCGTSCASGPAVDPPIAEGDPLAGLPAEVRAKVHNHPCFSEDAHHHYARMHVAVAPACNIQCHYCNRKYDCSNESRPGVVSELLTPEQAARKVLAVAAEIPQMTVLGIAGPGDPLANPERTFETFRQIARFAPDIKLCVSTNGLALPGLVDELCQHNIEHVTITINCIDPDIGAKIYPWIFWKNRRVTGRRAAEILIEQQLQGLELLTRRGVLVKVNSVLIPGGNDAHLGEVSQAVRARGAFLHNVMPLISEPEHGTFYGVMGQRGPTPEELGRVQEACAGDMRLMRHCRQCRADAVGMLGEDRGAEFTLERLADTPIDYAAARARRAEVHAEIEARRREGSGPRAQVAVSLASVTRTLRRDTRRRDGGPRPVRMAVATSGKGLVDLHFGHAGELMVYEASRDGVRRIGPRRVKAYCGGADRCGDGEDALERTIRALAGCEVVLCAKVGYEPWTRLESAGITPNGEHALEPIEEAVAAVYREMGEAGLLVAPPSIGQQRTA